MKTNAVRKTEKQSLKNTHLRETSHLAFLNDGNVHTSVALTRT